LGDGQDITQNTLFLQPPPGRRYVRSFLFSRRINAPFAQIHLITRTLLVLCMSFVQLRTIDAAHPDPVGASVFWLLSFLLFLMSGMHARVARIYFLLSLPALWSLFITWTLFNPVPGKIVLFQSMIYPGYLTIGFALWQVIWLAIVAGYFWWTRRLFVGLCIATVLVMVLSLIHPLPEWPFARIAFFHPLTVLISDRGLLVATTKVIGYSGMVLSTIALVVSARDAELIGTLRLLRMPQPLVFFLSTVFRALDLALSDYTTIHQAQIARAINARPRSMLRRLRDLGSIAVPMVAIMIRRSSEIGDALQSRGYTLQRAGVDFYEISPWRLIDWFVLAFSLLLLYMAIGPRFDLTALLQQWF
jgi:energy-coupling factor transporter transmembrane protein EcfT